MTDASILSPISIKPSSSFLQWQKIFSALLQMLQTQQSQIQTLATERKFLADLIHIQQNRWDSDVLALQDRISQMERACLEANMERVLLAKRFDLVLGMKHKEAVLYKENLDIAESDLEDLEHSLQVDKSEGKNHGTGEVKEGDVNMKHVQIIKDGEQSSKNLQREVRRLRVAFNELSSRKNSEVSALLAERNFAWNQFEKMEIDYTGLQEELKITCANLEKVEDTVERLLSTVDEKDSTISRLKAEVADSDVGKLTKELFKLKEELESIKSSSKTVLVGALSELQSCRLGKENNRKVMKREQLGILHVTDLAKHTKKVGRRSRKRGSEAIPCSQSVAPRLFTSSFRVPRLKKSSPLV